MNFSHGDLIKLAIHVGISKGQLANCLRGRRRLQPNQAEKIVKYAKELGYETTIFDWLYPQQSQNELFAKFNK
jgi:hypothetical protein